MEGFFRRPYDSGCRAIIDQGLELESSDESLAGPISQERKGFKPFRRRLKLDSLQDFVGFATSLLDIGRFRNEH